MTGHLLYTEQDRDRAYHAALNAPPCEHWEGDPRQGYATCIGCYVDAALAALSSANRLVPPGGLGPHRVAGDRQTPAADPVLQRGGGAQRGADDRRPDQDPADDGVAGWRGLRERVEGDRVNPWTDEDEDLLIRALWARANGRRLRADEPSPERGTMFGFQARAVLQALAAANRLVPPGSEVREEWGVWHQPPGRGVTFCVLSPDADCDDEEAWAREHAAAEPGSHVECRLHIVTPWSPSVPDTEEGS